MPSLTENTVSIGKRHKLEIIVHALQKTHICLTFLIGNDFSVSRLKIINASSGTLFLQKLGKKFLLFQVYKRTKKCTRGYGKELRWNRGGENAKIGCGTLDLSLNNEFSEVYDI